MSTAFRRAYIALPFFISIPPALAVLIDRGLDNHRDWCRLLWWLANWEGVRPLVENMAVGLGCWVFFAYFTLRKTGCALSA